MAFTWEVEALRKLIEGIVEEVEIKQAGDELAQEAIDAYNKRPEASQLWDVYKEEWVPNPDARVDPNDPFGLNDPDPVEGISYEEFYESLRDVDDSPLTEQEVEESNAAADAERYGLGYKEKDKLKLDWVNEILKEHAEKVKPDVIHLGDETARERQKDWTIHSAPDDAIQDYLDMAREAEDEDEYWKEYGRLERGIGVSPEVPPFLSYLLRQSPYARLPAAGLLGLGLMGYSKPAY